MTPLAQFSDIPTTKNTVATFEVQSTVPEKTIIRVDVDGNGVADKMVHPNNIRLSLTELLALFKESVRTLDINNNFKQNLLKRIANLEKKIETKKEQNSKLFASLKNNVSKQALKGNIAPADAVEIVALVELLEAESNTTSLDAEALAELKKKIISLDIRANLKNDLLRRATQLGNKQTLTKILTRLTESISKKAYKGKLSDADAQRLIGLLGQIENAL